MSVALTAGRGPSESRRARTGLQLIMENGFHLQEGMTFEGLVERNAWVFAYVFTPLPIVGATGSPGNPIAVL